MNIHIVIFWLMIFTLQGLTFIINTREWKSLNFFLNDYAVRLFQPKLFIATAATRYFVNTWLFGKPHKDRAHGPSFSQVGGIVPAFSFPEFDTQKGKRNKSLAFSDQPCSYSRFETSLIKRAIKKTIELKDY